MRLWDLRTPVCQALLPDVPGGRPVAAFDQQGLVFAVGADAGVVKLYDAAQFGKGPFETFVVRSWRRLCLRCLPALPGSGVDVALATVVVQLSMSCMRNKSAQNNTYQTPRQTNQHKKTQRQVPPLRNGPAPIRQLLFSNDGDALVAVAGATAFVLDAYDGSVKATIELGIPEDAPTPPVSLSFDGAYLISACGADGAVGVWAAATGAPVAQWRAAAADAAPRVAAWAPRRLMAASGATQLALWVPSPAAAARAAAAQ